MHRIRHCSWCWPWILAAAAVGFQACVSEGVATGSAAVQIHFRGSSGSGPGTRGVLDNIADTIRVSVSHGGEQLISPVSFAYGDGQGTVTNIPAGEGRVFYVEALAGSTTIYDGSATGVTIEANATATVAVTLSVAYTDDVYPPARIPDLSGQFDGSDVILTWTATGDDGTVAGSSAASYDLRYSDASIQDANFASATQIAGTPAPGPAGQPEQFTVPGALFPADNTYHFAVRAVDDSGNSSPVSNEAIVDVTQGGDSTAPADVTNLALAGVTDTSVMLTWTAPGDDGTTGTVTSYDVRYSTSAIDATNFDSASQAPGPVAPLAGGQTETLPVEGLATGTLHFFALKAVDEAGNWSGISNVVPGTPEDATAPAGVSDLAVEGTTDTSVTLTWTAPGDDGTQGTADRYDLRYSQGTIDDANFPTATQWATPPTPQAAGSSETVTIDGLTPAQSYTFALKTYDEVDNESPLSNVVPATPGSSDTIAPAAVVDLAAVPLGIGGVTLTWTAPGDDGPDQGTAAIYDIRYSDAPIDDLTFAAATAVAGPPAPQAALSAESLDVTGFPDDGPWYFALKTSDEVPNLSGLSNVPSTLVVVPPGDIVDLSVDASDDTSVTLGWTAPGDDGASGTATAYEIRYSEAPIDAGNFDAATEWMTPPVPQAAGGAEAVVIDSLTPGRHYYVRMRTRDDNDNWSGLSNQADQVLSCTVCPVIGAIRPAAAPSGALVYLEGSQLGAAEGTLTFGGQAAGIVSWSDSSVVATVPAAVSGAVDAVVTNTGGYSDTTTFQVTPHITAITPDTVSLPGTVSISGTGFGDQQGASTLSFTGAGIVLTVTTWSDTTIDVDISSGAVTGPVRVDVDGFASNDVLLTVGAGYAWGFAPLVDSDATPSVNPRITVEPGGDIQVIWVESDGADLEITGKARVSGIWGGAVDISDTSEDSTFGQILADAAAGHHLVWNEGGATASLQYQTGADATWSVAETVAPEVTSVRPAVGLLPDGTVLVAWVTGGTVRYAARDPVLTTWSAAADVAGAGAGGGVLAGAVDPAGNFHLITEDGATPGLKHAVFDGVAWTDQGAVATLTGAAPPVDAGADSLGGLHVVFFDAGTYQHASWDGTAWSAPQPIAGLAATAPQGLDLVVDSADNLHLVAEDDGVGVFEVMHAVRSPATGLWSAVTNLSEDGLADSREPALIALSDLTLRVVWAQSDRIYTRAWE